MLHPRMCSLRTLDRCDAEPETSTGRLQPEARLDLRPTSEGCQVCSVVVQNNRRFRSAVMQKRLD